MNYLKIFQEVIVNTNDECSGWIKPKVYSPWSEVSPLILLIEGINQFSVKASRLVFNLPDNIRFVPVQIKNFVIKKDFSYQDIFIAGKPLKKESLFEVSFTVTDQVILASGVVTITSLKEASND